MCDVNAFVAQNQPRRIFVGVPLALMSQTDEELAMVMAHEVSHALIGHTDEATYVSLIPWGMCPSSNMTQLFLRVQA